MKTKTTRLLDRNNHAFSEAFKRSGFTRKAAAKALKVSIGRIDSYLAGPDRAIYRPVSPDFLQHFEIVCEVKRFADAGMESASLPVGSIFPQTKEG